MGQTQRLSTLEALPNDMLRDIISRVARFSRRDVRNVMKSSPELAKIAPDQAVYKSLNLMPLAKNPLWAINRFSNLMTTCLAGGNMEAHYIKGLQEYFHHKKTTEGLKHLKISADGSYDDAIYLYGLLMLCRGQTNEGECYWEKLEWKKDTSRGDRCWRHIKRSLRGIPIVKRECYAKSLKKNKPTKLCKLNDMDISCHKCFYYKQMRKYVNFILHKE